MEQSAVKGAARKVVEAARDDLVTLSRQIHDNPELCFEETYASERVAETLAAGGFAVETGAYELPTAFEARAGSGPLSIVICAEYDALPGSATPVATT